MIAFFDTSALVALVIAELGSARAAAAWRAATRVHVIAPAAAEAHAALAAAHRLGRLDVGALATARSTVDRLLEECVCRIVDLDYATAAGAVAVEHQLRGYDAMQCLGALELEAAVGVAGDRALLDAWSRRGLATIDILAS
ncbi:MAG: PIN domain-containing protein [Agrococcus sp.]